MQNIYFIVEQIFFEWYTISKKEGIVMNIDFLNLNQELSVILKD